MNNSNGYFNSIKCIYKTDLMTVPPVRFFCHASTDGKHIKLRSTRPIDEFIVEFHDVFFTSDDYEKNIVDMMLVVKEWEKQNDR